MSKYFATVSKTVDADDKSSAPAGEYDELIQCLFQGRSAVAVVGVGLDKGVVGVCEEIAKQLAGSGKRVAIVPVDSLLRSEANFVSSISRNVWVWPSPLGRPLESLDSSDPNQKTPDNWLDILRQSFDSILLDCPAVDMMFGVTEVAAKSDSVVLVMQAGRTSKQQIQQDQRALQLRGARLAGCILLRKR